MIKTDEQLAYKIDYLKKNNFMPNIDKEGKSFKDMIKSFYSPARPMLTSDPFFFMLSFGAFQVSDKFVREVNKEFKRFQILNIGKGANDD